MNVQVFNYEGSPVTFQKGDGIMVNATQMAKGFGKKPGDWLKNQQTEEFLNALTKVKKITLGQLVVTQQGGNNPGIWFHEDVAMEFARWLSPAFAIWCNDRIKELLTEGVTTVSSDDEVKIFNHPAFGEVRTAGTPMEPLFCLADVCRALEIANPRNVVQRLNSKGVHSMDTPTAGGFQPMTYISESNLYKCIFQSRKEEAEVFQEWVTGEVLPSIRRTGGYIQATVEDTPEEIMAKALKIADRTMKDQQQRIQMLEGENEHLYSENERLAPKAQYTDEVLQSDSTYTFTQIAKELNFKSVGAFTSWLVAKRIAFRQSGMWLLTSKYAGQGYTTTRTYRYYKSDGTPASSTSTVWTEAGRLWIHGQRDKED